MPLSAFSVIRNELEYWNRFWSGKRCPLHFSASAEHYDNYADELKVLFRKGGYDRVLELACGTGVFYERLGFDAAAGYKGIDLSESMLEEFRKLHPDVVLQRTSAHDYLDENKYDLIYSNALVQYLDKRMLRSHFLNAEKMLSEGGEIIDASVPWRIHSRAFGMKKLTPPYHSLNKAALKSTVAWMLHITGIKQDKNGNWYTPRQVAKMAEEFGLVAEFFGSMHYPYRFHVVLRRRQLS